MVFWATVCTGQDSQPSHPTFILPNINRGNTIPSKIWYSEIRKKLLHVITNKLNHTLHILLVWRLVPKWPRNTLESWFPWKPRSSEFILFLNSLRTFGKLRNHLIPEQPRNPSEIQFPWLLRFLRNSESQTWKLNPFLFLITQPLIFILSYLLVSFYS